MQVIAFVNYFSFLTLLSYVLASSPHLCCYALASWYGGRGIVLARNMSLGALGVKANQLALLKHTQQIP
jgi:hypothetical protein